MSALEFYIVTLRGIRERCICEMVRKGGSRDKRIREIVHNHLELRQAKP